MAQVATGIYQVRLPLPFALKIVNCYVLEDGHGWAVLDCGLHYPPGVAGWQAALAELGIAPSAITQIILTHAHPDHYGMAGWLAAQSGAPVLLSPAEQEFAAQVWHKGAYTEDAFIAFFRRYGLPADLADHVQHDMRAIREMTTPAATQTIAPGEVLEVGRRRLVALHTPGHSDGHLAFYCAPEQLLLCGDTVLAKITPNIGIWPLGQPDPLADFLHTLDQLAGLEVGLALPGHGPLITGFAERIAEIQSHHAQRLQQIAEIAGDSATAFAICASVFPTATFSSHQIRFALAETLAHLEYLVNRGRLARIQKGDTITYCAAG